MHSLDVLYIICIILTLIIIILILNIIFIYRALNEIHSELKDKLENNTNTLITVSTMNPHIRKIASDLNKQLRLLRSDRRRFQQGDLELKDAVTNISHDIRTPLTAICGYLDLLEYEEKSKDANRYLCMIKNRTEVMKELTEELFRYSVITSSKEPIMERIVLNTILEECLASYYEKLTQSHIAPTISIPEQKIERYFDRFALVRIFENIISNAIKYSDKDFFVTLKENGTIIFSNTAKGITPLMAAQLFKRYYTVETGENSTGLGLSIAKLLTENMGGTISSEYKGDMLYITVYFPEDNNKKS